jgi:hypothetical protein
MNGVFIGACSYQDRPLIFNPFCKNAIKDFLKFILQQISVFAKYGQTISLVGPQIQHF